MFQTKKPFWIPATVTSSLSVIKKEGRACRNVSLVNRIWCLMFWFLFFFPIMKKQLSEMPDAVSQSFRSQNNQSVKGNKSVFGPLGSIASLGVQ